jgi:hypothetical protein
MPYFLYSEMSWVIRRTLGVVDFQEKRRTDEFVLMSLHIGTVTETLLSDNCLLSLGFEILCKN